MVMLNDWELVTDVKVLLRWWDTSYGGSGEGICTLARFGNTRAFRFLCKCMIDHEALAFGTIVSRYVKSQTRKSRPTWRRQ